MRRLLSYITIISIHAPRGRGDHPQQMFLILQMEFQSTPLAGGATVPLPLHREVTLISIHAPRGRGDRKPDQIIEDAIEFQSTPLAGGATSAGAGAITGIKFQSTPLAGGATL